MAQRSIRVGIKMNYVDDYGNIADNGDTLYYGEYEMDPAEGIRYTYVKAPDGHFDILKTENTDIAKEMIDNIVEVGLKDSNNYSPKLTFVLQFDEQDMVSTWNDRIEDLFKKEFAKLYPELKPTILQVKSSDISRAIMMPFYNEKAVVTDFELTPGRVTRNVGQLTVELFRRLMDATLKHLDQFLEILNEGFNSLDGLKLIDMKQDEKLGDISAAANSWELICELIEKWMANTMDKFKMLHKRFNIDLSNYRSNLLCAVRLFSNQDRDKPFIESQFFTPDGAIVSLLSTTKGLAIDLKINKGNTNEVLPALNQNSSIRLRGGAVYTVFSSAEMLEYQVMTTESMPSTKMIYDNTRIDTGDHHELDYHTWIGADSTKYPWHLALSGVLGDKATVGYVYNYLWRSNNTGYWGTAGNSGILKTEGAYFGHHNGSWYGPYNFSTKITVSDRIEVTLTVDTRYGGNFDYVGAYVNIISEKTGKNLQISRSWGSGSNWGGTFTDTVVLTRDQINELGGKGTVCRCQYGCSGNSGSGDFNFHYTWKIMSKQTTGDNTDALRQNRNIGEFNNTRIPLHMNMNIAEMRKRFKNLIIYTDSYFGLTSLGATGGIQGFRDSTGRCSYQGAGVFNNNVASIPDAKIRVPLNMINESSTSGALSVINVPTDTLADNGDWLLVYETPLSGSWFNYSIEHKRRKDKEYGALTAKFYIRVKDANTLELLVNYFQMCDGDDGDAVQVQCAGRTSALVVGFSDVNAILNVNKAFTNVANDVFTNPVADRQTRNYLYTDNVTVYDKTLSYDSTKIPNAIVTICCNANFQFQQSIDHKGTCWSSSSLAYGNLKTFNTRGWDDTTGGGPQVPAAAQVSLVDISDTTSMLASSQVIIKYQPSINVTNKLVKQIVLNRPFGERAQVYEVYVNVTNSGTTRNVRVWARFFASGGNSHRRNSRISFSSSIGFRIQAGGDGVSARLVTSRPSGRALELYDTVLKKSLYAPLVNGTENNYFYGESKLTSSQQWGGGTISRGWDQTINIGSSEDITIGVNANFDIRRSRDHSGTCWAETWGVYGNITTTKPSYWSDSSGGGPTPGAQSAPTQIQRNTLSGLTSCQATVSFKRGDLTDQFKEMYGKALPGNVTAYFRIRVRMDSATKITISYRFELGGLGGGRDGGKISYFAYYGVASRHPTRKTLSVTDLTNSNEYRLPDNSDIMDETTRALSMAFRNVSGLSRNTELLKTKLNISDIVSIKLPEIAKFLIGININLGTVISKPRKSINSNSLDNSLLVFGNNGELYRVEDDKIMKVNRNLSLNNFIDSFNENEIIDLVDNNTTNYPDEFGEVDSNITKFITTNVPLNKNVIFEDSLEPSSEFIEEPEFPTLDDIKNASCNMTFDLDQRYMSYLWTKIFSVKIINYKTNDIEIKTSLSLYGRVVDDSIQLGWRTDNESKSKYNFIQMNFIKWKYNILEVTNE